MVRKKCPQAQKASWPLCLQSVSPPGATPHACPRSSLHPEFMKTVFGTSQVENLLLSNQGTIKLCDFGSATTISHYPDYSWSAQRRALVEEEVSVGRGGGPGRPGRHPHSLHPTPAASSLPFLVAAKCVT